MASEQAAVSTAAPVFSANISEPATIPTATTISQPDSDPTRAKSLKRSRPEQMQNPTNLSSIANAGLGASPSPKSPRFIGSFSPAFTPAPLTGAAALDDQRRQREENQNSHNTSISENPAHKALSSLVAGGGAGMSRPKDAPAATTAMSEGMSTVANAISIPSPMHYDDKTETSPASVTSLASLGSSTAPTATASSTVAASPATMAGVVDMENRDTRFGGPNQLGQALQTEEQPSNRALTFPGNVLAQQDPSRLPPRGMSLPMPDQQLAPRSPSQKKHKCPYCETEFTRHHNLKSHLLTHSQEKPYVCQTCNMRFRRLHDLKRHMKLHTGERPHICPKCDRKFARGDALARHSKGQGGCAGRRASMGSFGGDDDYDGSNAGDGDDTGMDGVMYTNGAPPEGEMTEEERRRFSLPTIKAQHVARNTGSQDNYNAVSRTPSTYPPAGPRPGQSTGGLYPPPDRASSSSGTSPILPSSVGRGHTASNSLSSMGLSTGGGSIFSQSGMTESPKPLSPSGVHSHQLGHDPSSINRQRSPSLTTQFQQQHFGRRQSGRASPTNMSLPSPHTSSQGPRLPAIPGLAPPDQRYTLTSQTPTQQTLTGSHPAQQGPPMTTATSPSSTFQPPAGRVGSGHHQQGSSDNSANLFAGGDRGVWQYVQTLEERVKQLSEKVVNMESNEKSQGEKVKRLEEELNYLRSQSQTQNQAPRPPGPGHS